MASSAWILYNPSAGRINTLPLVRRAARILSRAGWRVRLRATRGRGQIVPLARQCAAEAADVLFVAGGDGTVGQAASALVGTPTALGVLPTGTANLWARELGLRGPSLTNWSALDDAVRRQLTGKTIRVDVGRCNGEPFLLWAGVGLDAHVIRRIEPRPTWLKPLGILYYTAAAFVVSADWTGLAFEVRADEARLTGHYLVGVVGNIRAYGGGRFDLSPGSRPDDGVMELTLFEGASYPDALRRTAELYAGQHLASPHVRQIAARSFEIRTDRPGPVQMDGEPVRTTTPVTIEVEPRALRVLWPAP